MLAKELFRVFVLCEEYGMVEGGNVEGADPPSYTPSTSDGAKYKFLKVGGHLILEVGQGLEHKVRAIESEWQPSPRQRPKEDQVVPAPAQKEGAVLFSEVQGKLS